MAVVRQEDVLRFEITVDDSLVVRRRETARDLRGVLDRPADGHRSAVGALPERLALEELGHDERRSRVRAHVVHRQDVGMIQRRGGARFALEPRQPVAVLGKRRGDDLDGNVTCKARIARPVDLAHAAGAKGGHDRVRSEPSAGRQLQG